MKDFEYFRPQTIDEALILYKRAERRQGSSPEGRNW